MLMIADIIINIYVNKILQDQTQGKTTDKNNIEGKRIPLISSKLFKEEKGIDHTVSLLLHIEIISTKTQIFITAIKVCM